MTAAAAPPPATTAAPRAALAGLVAGAIALCLFGLTASPWVASHDAAQFQTLARTGGIAHAGYPALVLVLEAFGRLPFATLPMRANLVSVIAGAVVVGLAAWAGTRLAARAWAGLAAALGLALALTFWKESTHAGVHAFTLALAVVAFHLLVRFSRRPSPALAFALGTVAGLGLVSHLTILALGPPALLAFALALRSGRLTARAVAPALAGLLLGLTPLAYLLAHDRPEQPMNYLHDTLRPDNAAELSGGDPPVGRFARMVWLLSARQFLGGYVFSPFADTPQRLRDLLLDGMLNDFPLWGLPLALLGAWWLWRRRDRVGAFLGLWLAGALLLVAFAARPGMGPIFFLPGLWVGAQLIAVALAGLTDRSRLLGASAGLLLVLTPLARVAIAEPPGPLARAGATRLLWRVAPVEWSPFASDTTWDAYGRGVMAALPPRAVVLACWEEATTLRYFRHGERLRDDVDILYHCRHPLPALPAADSAGRPVFTTYPLTPEMTGGRPFHGAGRWARGGLWRIEGPPAARAAATPGG